MASSVARPHFLGAHGRFALLTLLVLAVLDLQVPIAEAHTLRATHGSRAASSFGHQSHAASGRQAKAKVKIKETVVPLILRDLALVLLVDANATSNLTNDLVNVSEAVLNSSEVIAEEVVNASEVIEQEVVNASEAIEQEVVNVSEVITSEVEEVIEEHPFSDAVLKAFVVVGIAEAFDRSWIATVLCVVQYGAGVSATGASVALMLQVFLTAGMGIASRELFDYRILHLATAGVLGVMASISAWNFYHTHPDSMAVTSKRRLDKLDSSKEMLNSSASAAANVSKRWWAPSSAPVSRQFAEETLAVFVLVFRAELGDQTQLAMISLQSTDPLLAVSYGALAALGVMLVSACAIGSMLSGEQLRERTLFLVSAVTFGLFACVSLWQAFHVPPKVQALERAPS